MKNNIEEYPEETTEDIDEIKMKTDKQIKIEKGEFAIKLMDFHLSVVDNIMDFFLVSNQQPSIPEVIEKIKYFTVRQINELKNEINRLKEEDK